MAPKVVNIPRQTNPISRSGPTPMIAPREPAVMPDQRAENARHTFRKVSLRKKRIWPNAI
jgi:hypothetical protein